MAQATAEKTNEIKAPEPTKVEITLEMILARMDELHKKIDDLKAAGPARGSRQSQREMNDDDARAVLAEHKDLKHNEAADKLGLSYGQVYSARLGYTFKHIRKELTDDGVKSPWLDTTHNG